MTPDDASFTPDGQAKMLAELPSPGGPGDSHSTKAFKAAMIERTRAGKGRIEGELGNRDRLLLTVTSPSLDRSRGNRAPRRCLIS
jgi:hypothetical protein